MGALTPEEVLDVEKNLAMYPELRKELRRIELAQEEFLQKLAVLPPPELKGEIFDQINGKGDAGLSELSKWRWMAAASVTLFVVASSVAVVFYNRWRVAERELIALSERNQSIAENFNRVNQQVGELYSELAIVNDESFQKVSMKGTANAPEAAATVYWNAKTNELYLRVQNMSGLPAEKQYQLWAIINGKPVDAGVFDAESAGLLKMKAISAGATTFAVTIEPRGGKASPSLETMQVAGNV